MKIIDKINKYLTESKKFHDVKYYEKKYHYINSSYLKNFLEELYQSHEEWFTDFLGKEFPGDSKLENAIDKLFEYIESIRDKTQKKYDFMYVKKVDNEMIKIIKQFLKKNKSNPSFEYILGMLNQSEEFYEIFTNMISWGIYIEG